MSFLADGLAAAARVGKPLSSAEPAISPPPAIAPRRRKSARPKPVASAVSWMAPSTSTISIEMCSVIDGVAPRYLTTTTPVMPGWIVHS